MIVKYKEDLAGGPFHRKVDSGSSLRFLTRADGVGFTLTDTVVEPGREAILHYKNHIEANYVLEGEGTLEDLATGKTYAMRPGMMYTLDKHDRHKIVSKTRLRIICVFTPALVGSEVHDKDGSYPIL
ncbi:MAG: ectoine synthase [Alphaproteobacteria bacterium]